MRSTSYICDWCKASIPPNDACELSLRPVEFALVLARKHVMKADLCDRCCIRLENWIASLGNDEGGEGARLPVIPKAPEPGKAVALEDAQDLPELLDSLERMYKKDGA